jgi:hypothetical protein
MAVKAQEHKAARHTKKRAWGTKRSQEQAQIPSSQNMKGRVRCKIAHEHEKHKRLTTMAVQILENGTAGEGQEVRVSVEQSSRLPTKLATDTTQGLKSAVRPFMDHNKDDGMKKIEED